MLCCKRELAILMIFLVLFQLVVGNPILGQQTEFEDNSKVQGQLRPIFKFCDQIENHLNCMMSCKSLGYGSGHCDGDFTCSCF